ncbi:MAG TPA: hypothetical protein VHT91_20470 [Kofleriaceae bacterium]|nr:hypothetical protein [Kofleriaceae bacterium]
MGSTSGGWAVAAAVWIAAAGAGHAQPAPPGPDSAAAAAAAAAAPDRPVSDDPSAAMAERLDELEARLATAEQTRRARFPIKLSGYGDLGWFATQGDGSGWRRDAGHVIFPDRSQYAWVFYGDLLATQVNSRGDVADLGDAPGVQRFDSIHARGNSTFLINELNLTVNAGLGDRALFTSSVNFTPRTGTDFALGDSFDVDLVQLELLPTQDGKTSIFVGKVDSVLGNEYKTRKAPDRFGITPSLVARYTTGTAVGVKLRSKLADDHVILAAAVTNGSFGTEQFHFFREIDSNDFKTLSGRAALRWPVASGTFEAGVWAQWGAQDGAPNGAGAEWFVGGDAELSLDRIDLKAQWLTGRAPGDAVSRTYGLDLKQGGALEADVIATPLIGVLGRIEFRHADVTEGFERLYITRNWRATAGIRLVLHPHATLKAEYSHNGEYGGVPAIPDDVVTGSAVLSF